MSQMDARRQVVKRPLWRFLIVLLLVIAPLIGSRVSAQVLSLDKESIFALELAPVDLGDATRVMTVHDRNDDGWIDQEEQKRLPWRNQVGTFDLTADGKMAHLEVALRFAAIRAQAGVEQEHVNNAMVYMRRHDKNRNGQLDPEEILNGWPKDPGEFDSDKDGVISLAEIAKRFSFMGGLRKEMGIERVDQVTAIRTVRKHDLDKDQRLDAEEQKGAYLPLSPASFDNDGDGKLGIQEIATLLAKHRRETGMSPSDLAQLRTLFEQFDGNGDGVIDQSEAKLAGRLSAAASNAASENESAVGAFESAIRRFDSSGDGNVTLAEAGQFLIQQRSEIGFSDADLAEAKKLFTRHDANRSTSIDETELFETPVSGQLPKSLLDQADQNDDDRLSLVELARHLARKRGGTTKSSGGGKPKGRP